MVPLFGTAASSFTLSGGFDDGMFWLPALTIAAARVGVVSDATVGTLGPSDGNSSVAGMSVGALDGLMETNADGRDEVDNMSDESPMTTNGKVPTAP